MTKTNKSRLDIACTYTGGDTGYLCFGDISRDRPCGLNQSYRDFDKKATSEKGWYAVLKALGLYIARRPLEGYSHYWRQEMLITTPWNPDKDFEDISLMNRKLYVVIVLCFNLLALTEWSAIFLSDRSGSAQYPSLKQYVLRHFGVFLLQRAAGIIFRPFFYLRDKL